MQPCNYATGAIAPGRCASESSAIAQGMPGDSCIGAVGLCDGDMVSRGEKCPDPQASSLTCNLVGRSKRLLIAARQAKKNAAEKTVYLVFLIASLAHSFETRY